MPCRGVYDLLVRNAIYPFVRLGSSVHRNCVPDQGTYKTKHTRFLLATLACRVAVTTMSHDAIRSSSWGIFPWRFVHALFIVVLNCGGFFFTFYLNMLQLVEIESSNVRHHATRKHPVTNHMAVQAKKRSFVDHARNENNKNHLALNKNNNRPRHCFLMMRSFDYPIRSRWWTSKWSTRLLSNHFFFHVQLFQMASHSHEVRRNDS